MLAYFYIKLCVILPEVECSENMLNQILEVHKLLLELELLEK